MTAAGQGIGRAIAEAFIAEGAKVIATDLDTAKLKGLRGAAARLALDVRSTPAVNALAKDLQREFGAARHPRQRAPASCTTAPCWIARRQTGISRSTSTSSRCTA